MIHHQLYYYIRDKVQIKKKKKWKHVWYSIRRKKERKIFTIIFYNFLFNYINGSNYSNNINKLYRSIHFTIIKYWYLFFHSYIYNTKSSNNFFFKKRFFTNLKKEWLQNNGLKLPLLSSIILCWIFFKLNISLINNFTSVRYNGSWVHICFLEVFEEIIVVFALTKLAVFAKGLVRRIIRQRSVII